MKDGKIFMKATGSIRRIDELGRVIIPKEIRRTLKISKGDPLEIFVDNDCVCFKKYDVGKQLIEEIIRLQNGIRDDIYDITIVPEKRAEIFQALDALMVLLKDGKR